MLVFRILIALFCLIWVAQAALFVRNQRGMRTLAKLTPPEPDSWPRVSVIAPARDEADGIGPALRSRLADDYPDLEVVAIDDRSTDGTGEIIRGLAEGDSRLVTRHIEELPPGWLGKVHALKVGTEAASGEWLLFSDADVHVEPGTTRRAIAHAIAEGFDHIALIPEYGTGSIWVEAIWAVFMRMFGIMFNFRAIRDSDNPKAVIGSGAFNLVRREAFEATEGFEWLKLETTDDMSLGVLMKRNGFRSEGLDGFGSASVLIYRNLAAFYRGTEKNAGAVLGTPFPLFLAGTLVWLTLEWSSLIALAIGPAWLRILGGFVLVLVTALHVRSLKTNTGRIGAAFLWPIGSALFASTLVRATWLAHRRGGIMWRDTLYPIEEIIAARRYTLGMNTVTAAEKTRVGRQ